MKYVGIIAEYNPFHTGHARLLSAVRGAEAVVCVMSGNFVQRGEAAILPPAVRAEMALAAGADAVLELPFPYAAASARYFATAGVRALAGVGVDTIAFGSETGELDRLTALAEKAPDRAERKTPERGDAAAYFDTLGEDAASNDILAIEYLRAIRREAPFLTPFVLKREGTPYRAAVTTGAYPSATALREKLLQGEKIDEFLPPEARGIFAQALADYGVADTARLGDALLAFLRGSGASLARTADIAECGGGLLERLIKAAETATDYRSLCGAAATKRYTDGRIRRALLCLLAGVRTGDLSAHPAYLRLLGANARGREFLAATQRRRTVPLVTKQSEIAALGEAAKRQRALSLAADGLYAIATAHRTSPHDLQTAKPILKK